MHTAFRRLLVAALFLVLTLLAGRPAKAQEPALTIVLSGNTYGNYEPCPS
ncbi:MAG: hypothetical protein B193_1324 [Solidesulfovibrio magneticus str. Maddingley MBC34]|uniref:Uncharacterized protein n=1 Tax=Solidesulfovibrio magneticus str. Maddingley MBC34 TaxID=1206767 RepID=K6GFU3_9BACT|nr:MAG: hypothetical protein B193_1324 [Solidesulfovibrio magneticus str. Maddingley MBC34]